MFYKTMDSPLGKILAIANEKALVRLEFSNKEIVNLSNSVLEKVEEELNLYFNHKMCEFTIPFHLEGTAFQHKVWMELIKIPFGATCSYLDIAKKIGKPTAFRAVANANRMNPIAIIVPCHRVINHNGNLCGYAGGVEKKRWLLDHENQIKF